ncbi:chymotrypsin inhibitor-like [Lithobates pipiens]
MGPSSGFLLILIGVSFILTHAGPVADTECPPNQEYQQCGTACPLTCSNVNKLQMCTLQCVPGCFCKSAYILLEGGNNPTCVLPRDCPSSK